MARQLLALPEDQRSPRRPPFQTRASPASRGRSQGPRQRLPKLWPCARVHACMCVRVHARVHVCETGLPPSLPDLLVSEHTPRVRVVSTAKVTQEPQPGPQPPPGRTQAGGTGSRALNVAQGHVGGTRVRVPPGWLPSACGGDEAAGVGSVPSAGDHVQEMGQRGGSLANSGGERRPGQRCIGLETAAPRTPPALGIRQPGCWVGVPAQGAQEPTG